MIQKGLILLWFVLILSIVIPMLAGCGHEADTQPVEFGTLVNDSITSDTIWTSNNHPYIIKSDIVIDGSATLTIQPGVEVRFDGFFELIVHGVLVSDGRPIDDDMQMKTSKLMAQVTKPIIFTSNRPYPNIGDWKGIRFDNTNNYENILRCTKIAYADTGVYCFSSQLVITDCLFSDNQTGIKFEHSRPIVEYNNLTNNLMAILVNSEYVSNLRPKVVKNNITKNEIGIKSLTWLTAEENNLNNNEDFSLIQIAKVATMSNNWWGSTDLQVVERLVNDEKDNHKLGRVTYLPMATSPIVDAGPRCMFP